MTRGGLYVAMGEPYLREAAISARSFKRQMGDVPLALITDRAVESPSFETVTVVEDPEYGFGDVVRHIDDSPFERTLYLDTDTYVHADVTELFTLLDRFDVAATPDHTGYHVERYGLEHPIDGVPEGFPWYNGGVLGFADTPDVRALFDAWKATYERHRSDGIVHNMPSLRHALYFTDVRIATLSNRYNCVFREPGQVRGSVKVFHGRLLDIDGPGASRGYDVDDAVDAIASSDRPRVFLPLADGSFEVIDSKPENVLVYDPLLHRVVRSIRRDGAMATARKASRTLFGRPRS